MPFFWGARIWTHEQGGPWLGRSWGVRLTTKLLPITLSKFYWIFPINITFTVQLNFVNRNQLLTNIGVWLYSHFEGSKGTVVFQKSFCHIFFQNERYDLWQTQWVSNLPLIFWQSSIIIFAALNKNHSEHILIILYKCFIWS